jgi:MFS transporter, DHA2 family, multidrug resistance protein
MAPIAGGLFDRHPAGILGGLGLALLGLGMVLLAVLPTSPHVAAGCGVSFLRLAATWQSGA